MCERDRNEYSHESRSSSGAGSDFEPSDGCDGRAGVGGVEPAAVRLKIIRAGKCAPGVRLMIRSVTNANFANTDLTPFAHHTI